MIPKVVKVLSLAAALIAQQVVAAADVSDLSLHLIKRLDIHVGPHDTGIPYPVSPGRDPRKVCRVKADPCKNASPAIL